MSKLPPSSYGKSPTGDVFVKAETCKGILPQILEEPLRTRTRTRTRAQARARTRAGAGAF